MIFKDMLAKFEELAPQKYALTKDNTGFQIGSLDKEIKRICIALDATDDVIGQAVSAEVDLLLTHHPLLYNPVTQILASDYTGRRVMQLIKNDINYMSLHTNFDVMVMAGLSADIFGLLERQILWITFEEGEEKQGIGRFGKLSRKMALRECVEIIKSRFKTDAVLVYGDKEKIINTVAICPGSSSSILKYAVNAGVDLLITGDIEHHMALEALGHGICLVDAGHYGTEKIFVPYMIDFFRWDIPGMDVFAAMDDNPFYIV